MNVKIAKLNFILNSASGGDVRWVVCTENTMKQYCKKAGVEYDVDWGLAIDIGDDSE